MYSNKFYHVLAVLDLVLNNKENVIRIIHTKYDRSIHNLNIIKVQNSSPIILYLVSFLLSSLVFILLYHKMAQYQIAKNENIYVIENNIFLNVESKYFFEETTFQIDTWFHTQSTMFYANSLMYYKSTLYFQSE